MSKYFRLGLIAVIGVSCVLLFLLVLASQNSTFLKNTTHCSFGLTPSSRWYFSDLFVFFCTDSTAELKEKIRRKNPL